jgi:type III secretory pathway lipoprotein EscJ
MTGRSDPQPDSSFSKADFMHAAGGDQPRRLAARVTPAQVVGIGLVVMSLGWAAWLLRDRPISEEVELLPGTVLPSSEMAIIEAAFDRAQLIDHRTEDGRVWVPRPRQSAYMRALVDAEALPREFGSRLRDAAKQTSPWQSRAVQEEMRKVAVQEELACVICSMPGIERAAVFYDVDARASAGLASGPDRTASVNIRTQPGIELEPARVHAIRVLVAASIAGLSAERVAVTDLRSGRVFSGPMTADTDESLAAADPTLARRIAHERHLTAKLRQALAYVKGAVIDVTVTFPPPAPWLPPPANPPSDQPVASANTPAAIGEPITTALAPIDDTSPASILVSLAVPDDFFTGLDADAAESLEERLRDHVMSILPPTPRPDGRRLILSRVAAFPHGTSRTSQRSAPAAAPLQPTVATESDDERHISLETAWKAILGGRAGDVPREVWLAVIAVAAGLLGLLVLRPRKGEPRMSRPPRRQPEPIDWSDLDGRSAASATPEHPHRTAA